MKRTLVMAWCMVCLGWLAMSGQESTAQPQLFTYPVAPDTCSTLESRCNYVIQHFWDDFDISRRIDDDAALEKTFRDYVDLMPHTHRNILQSSIRNLVFKAQSNNSNLIKIAQLAEITLFGPNAEFWSDEIYVYFVQPLLQVKQLPKEMRQHYSDQLKRINLNIEGNVMDFEYTDASGRTRRLSDTSANSYVILLTDDNINSSIARTRLGTDVGLNAAIDSGYVQVIDIDLEKSSQAWQQRAAGYPSNWINGCSESLLKTIDLRVIPSCYILDENRRIVSKNVLVDRIKNAFMR